MLRFFSSPSTLPHLISLVAFSGFLYVAMKIDLFGSEAQGGVIFLSLSISYFFAALIAPSRFGEWMFNSEYHGTGILNRNYWIGGFARILPILVVAGVVWVLSNFVLGDDNLNKVKLFLAMLFIVMSVFQGISLTFGWVVYARKVQKVPRNSKTGGLISLVRSGIAVIVFTPLVWWFGYGTEDPRNAKLSANIVWLLFLIIIALLGTALDRYTKRARERQGADGVALDMAFFLIFITACWHLLGALRRSPLTTDQSTGGMLIEEGALMSISILLAVWSMSNKGKKKGWRIFQGQSAIFWGIGFGFTYAGSITSLTVLSEGSLLTTTAIGHAITALVMMAILPVSISWVGKPDTEEEKQPLVLQSVAVTPQKMSNPTDTERRTNEDEDIVELLD
tara:strand:+ start:1961 stop:3139 length:1179 start_codon:yes stop_codon:yes gene_type:complete